MQYGDFLRFIATTRNPENDDSDSDVTIRANSEINTQYLYYRLFTNEIGITSNQPAFDDNPHLGRVRRDSIAPPQMALNFKRRLCNIEDITDFASSTLYPSASNLSTIHDGDHVSDALGSTMDNPMVLVVEIPNIMNGIRLKYPQAQYIYYSLYTEEGVIEPKISFKTYSDGSPSIARINRNLIPPQYDRDAAIRCIAYVEGFSPCTWHQLFASVVSKSPIDALNIWDMQPGCPGSLPERPLVFVKSAYLTKRGILRNYPTELYTPGSTPLKNRCYMGSIYSDGVVRQEVLLIGDSKGPQMCSVYRVSCNSMRAFVLTTDVIEFK